MALAPALYLTIGLVNHALPPACPSATCRRPRVAHSPECSRKSRKRKKEQAAAAQQQGPEPAASSQLSDSGVAMRKKLVCDANGCRLEDAPTSVLNDLLPATESGNPLLPTPAAYEELLASRAEPGVVTVVRYGAPWCHSCRRIGPALQELAAERYPGADFYELSLVRNGKAAGERMHRHYKARGVRTMPFLEVFDGAELVAQMDASELSLRSDDRP